MDDKKKLVVQRWIIKAEEDLTSARNDLGDDSIVTATACFHAQQCVEKCLKAFLVQVDHHIERTHALLPLLEVCAKYDKNFSDFADIADELTPYAVETRYPDDWREIPVEEAKLAVSNAEKVMEFVKGKLNI